MFKKFININRLVEKNEPCKNINTWAFRLEDHIVIEIKVDGSNASIHYDASTGKVRAESCGKMFGKSAGGLAIHLAQGILERMDREREREENEQP